MLTSCKTYIVSERYRLKSRNLDNDLPYKYIYMYAWRLKKKGKFLDLKSVNNGGQHFDLYQHNEQLPLTLTR